MSVVIGTHNRADLLEQALASLLAQTCPRERLDIIVVDNGSTDRTSDLVQALLANAPHLRYVLEPRLGLSNARNRGIAEASGDLVAFFDDDGDAEPDWADRVLAVFDADPDVGAVGGRIRVGWPDGRPAWMPASLEGYYGHFDHGDAPRTLQLPVYPFGPNMTIRRPLLLAINGFRSELGPRGRNIMSCGETDLFARLHQRPLKVVYEPRARVVHWVEPERATRRWSLRRAYRHGLSTSIMQFVNGEHRLSLWVARLGLACRRAVVGIVAATTGRLFGSEESVVMSRLGYAFYWTGFARGTISNLWSGQPDDASHFASALPQGPDAD